MQGLDQRTSRIAALESAELLGCDDDNFIATMHRHVLRAFAVNAAHQFAESGLRVLKDPVALSRFGRLGYGRL